MLIGVSNALLCVSVNHTSTHTFTCTHMRSFYYWNMITLAAPNSNALPSYVSLDRSHTYTHTCTLLLRHDIIGHIKCWLVSLMHYYCVPHLTDTHTYTQQIYVHTHTLMHIYTHEYSNVYRRWCVSEDSHCMWWHLKTSINTLQCIWNSVEKNTPRDHHGLYGG